MRKKSETEFMVSLPNQKQIRSDRKPGEPKTEFMVRLPNRKQSEADRKQIRVHVEPAEPERVGSKTEVAQVSIH